MRAATLLLSCTLALSACAAAPVEEAPLAAPRPQALSLLGTPLYAPDPGAAAERLTLQLDEARAAWEKDRTNVDAIIWLGRRHAYLGDYRAAIDVFTDGIALHPRDARLYRHRGHRYITTRQFDRAVADLETAAQLIRGTEDTVEPDGAPNAANIPLSTLHTNVWYHLGLAWYLQHDFARALPAWQKAVEASTNDDMLVASSDWLYMTLRRVGRDEEAARVLERITPDMQLLENHAYHRRLMMYAGHVSPDSVMPAGADDPVQVATYGYGIANWLLVNGDAAGAERVLRRVVQGRNWAVFGYIAAEAELARRR